MKTFLTANFSIGGYATVIDVCEIQSHIATINLCNFFAYLVFIESNYGFMPMPSIYFTGRGKYSEENIDMGLMAGGLKTTIVFGTKRERIIQQNNFIARTSFT